MELTREQIAEMINCEVDGLTRIQGVNWEEDWQVGDILTIGRDDEVNTRDLGMSWSNGGTFECAHEHDYIYLIEIEGTVKGHEVDYNSEFDQEHLCIEDCEDEKEVLLPVGTQLRVTYISDEEDAQMMGYYTVRVEPVED